MVWSRLVWMNIADLLAVASALPDVVLKEYDAWTSITFRGKGFAWVHHGKETAMIKGTHDERAALVATDPDTFSEGWASSTTAWVRVQLPGAAADEVAELVTEAWRLTATKQAVREYDAAQAR